MKRVHFTHNNVEIHNVNKGVKQLTSCIDIRVVESSDDKTRLPIRLLNVLYGSCVAFLIKALAN